MLQIFKDEKAKVGFPFGTLCVLHYEAFADQFNKDIYRIAAAIELLTLSFDIIDDLQDNDTEYIWNKTPALSLNVSISMIIIATKIIRDSSFNHKDLAVQIFDKYTLLSLSGQQKDLLNCCRDEDSYLNMIEQKSGSLMTLSCLIGTVLAIGRTCTYVREYSKYIGIVQQIKNDIQDLEQWNRKNDLLNKKYSLPIIFLLSTKNNVSENILNYYNNDSLLDIYSIKKELVNSGAIRYAIAIKNVFKNKALLEIQNTTMSTQSKEYLKKLTK